MQLHQLKGNSSEKKTKRIGRGGKRGSYSGKGQKGQKSRAGHRIRPGFRGGNEPLWKVFPKQRGATKKVDIKHAKFQVRYSKPNIVKTGSLNEAFKESEVVSIKSLFKKGLISSSKNGVKILLKGKLNKSLKFNGVKFSKTAAEAVQKAGGVISE